MKAIKYLVMGVLLAGFSATANAQEAELQAALDGIKSKAPNVADLTKTAYKKNKKDADALMKIARAYYEQKDTAGAILFCNYANEAGKPKYQYAPAYLLLGDIEASYGNDGGKAAGYYNQAINFDPTNPEGYKKWAMVYRKISPSQAAKKLQDMKAMCPNEDVDAITAHIYMLAGDEKQAYENYAKSDVSKLDKGYLNEYVRASYFTGHFEDALKAAEAGLKIEPRNPTFNRLAMFSNYELKKYDAAKAYIHKYFNETDSAKFSEYDHFYTALIYQALEDLENMYIHYDKALELVNDSSMIKRHAILKSVSDSYLKDQQFDNAIKYYNEYLACKPELNSDDMEGLAKIYSKYADADEANKPELIGKAIDAYKAMAEKFPIQSTYAAYQCATMNNKLDKTGEKGLAKPDYQKVIDLLEGKADRDNSENTMLKYSYHYLMSNAFIYGKNKALAKEYADKILAIDPEYAPAQQIKELK
ncbi:MAG: tetratricopeptide repeat protein [Prevotella sp.]|nr:tetratricopeptide repeat protein [Prevotella sp.]MBR3109794.1 tetratricopeptide repeat protein [Prevotella sp.]